MRVDLVLRNADVRTMDARHPRAHALAVHHGRVLAVDDLTGLEGEHDVDCQGALVLPGFSDAHNHMAWFGLALDEIDLVGVRDPELVYALVAEKAADTPAGHLVVGSGYDDNDLSGPLELERLDRAADGRQVWLKHRSGHICMVNSPLLEQIGVLGGETTAPEGGVIEHDASGSPTGVLQERAQNLVVAHVTPYSLLQLGTALSAASRVYARQGLTHVTECGIGRGWLGKTPLEVAAYRYARDHDGLDVRVRLMPSVDALHDVHGHDDDSITFGLDLGLATGFGDDHVRLGAMKIWTDGSMLGRTAAMLEDYCAHGQQLPGHHGYLQDDPDRMRRQVIAAHRSGWDVAAHAIGDRAVDFALDAFADAQAQFPRPNARHRIEHAGVTDAEQVRRCAELGVTPVPQARFLHDIGDAMLDAVGPARADHLYRHKSFLDVGCRVPGSSDRPVVDGSPLRGIESMVTRRSAAGVVIGPGERVDVETAIRAYTVDTAWIARDEGRRGTLAPGFLADLVVLADDITAIEADRIGDTRVLATVLDGRATHDDSFDLPRHDGRPHPT